MAMHVEKVGTLRDLLVPRVQIYDFMVYLVFLVVFGLRHWPFWVFTVTSCDERYGNLTHIVSSIVTNSLIYIGFLVISMTYKVFSSLFMIG